MAGIIRSLNDLNDLSVEQKTDIATDEFLQLLDLFDTKYQSLFNDNYEDVDFLFDLMRVGITADCDLMQEEIDLIRNILNEAADADPGEDAIISEFKTTTADHYKLVQDVFAKLEPDDAKHIVAFLGAIVSIDGRLSEQEIAFIDSLFDKV